MSKHNPVAKAIDDMFKAERWPACTRFLEDGRDRLTNNAVERTLHGVALGRKSWLFAGSKRGGDRAAFMDSLIVTATMNDVDPQAWLGDVLAKLPGTAASRVPDLLPWNWKALELRRATQTAAHAGWLPSTKGRDALSKARHRGQSTVRVRPNAGQLDFQ